MCHISSRLSQMQGRCHLPRPSLCETPSINWRSPLSIVLELSELPVAVRTMRLMRRTIVAPSAIGDPSRTAKVTICSSRPGVRGAPLRRAQKMTPEAFCVSATKLAAAPASRLLLLHNFGASRKRFLASAIRLVPCLPARPAKGKKRAFSMLTQW